MSLPAEEKPPRRVEKSRGPRGHGEKKLKGPRPKGRKARLDEFEWARKQFFEYLERVEMDRLYWPAEYKRRGYKGDHTWPGQYALLDRKNRYSLCFGAWHYESMITWRERFLHLWEELSRDGLIEPFPDYLIRRK